MSLFRASIVVAPDREQGVVARLLEVFPAGHEVVARSEGVELAVYGGEEDVARMRGEFGSVRVEPVEPGWEEAWKRFHTGVSIGRLWVGPPWEAPPAGAVAVVIDPGRAFGTGAHPTTRLSIELLLELPQGSVLDVGCGSGVVAIAAAKLGHAPVDALDVDEAAVAATRENARLNEVDVRVRQADALVDPLPRADAVVANIAADVVRALAPGLSTRFAITSGYFVTEDVLLTGFRHVIRREAAGWAADLYERE